MTALEEIKKALEGVTHAPGKWEADGTAVYCDDATGQRVCDTKGEYLFWSEDQKRNAAVYIAATNPVAISELLSTIESLQRENVELRAWQAGALSCREAEQARIDDYKRELEEALCAQDIATREHTAAFGIAQTRAEVAEAEVMRLRALSVVGEPPFEFDRYISGALMAEGVRIEKIETLEKAMVVAAKVASRGPNGEVPVLIMRARTVLSSTGDTHGN